MKPFSELAGPLIVSSLRQYTGQAVIEDIKLSEAAGACAFILHIQLLAEEYRNVEVFRRIAAATQYPIMAINYRGHGQSFTDDERLEIQMEAVKSGFRSVDLPVYLFDENPEDSLKNCPLPFAAANPKEISMDAGAVARQIETVKRFKALGAEVLMSAHVGVELTPEQALSLALEIERRGADIVKIVSTCDSPEHALKILETNLELKKRLKVPFIYTCGGYHGKLIRRVAPLFGTMLVFGHHEYGELSNREKPLVKDLAHFYELTGGYENR